VAVSSFGTESARALLDGGACVNMLNSQGQTPLSKAMEVRHRPSVDLLLQHGAVPSGGE
jgi:ankyrin repeat protein